MRRGRMGENGPSNSQNPSKPKKTMSHEENATQAHLLIFF